MNKFFIIFFLMFHVVEAAVIVEIFNESSLPVEIQSSANWSVGNPVVITRSNGVVEYYGRSPFTLAPGEKITSSYVYIPWKEKNGVVIDEKLVINFGDYVATIQEYSDWAIQEFIPELNMLELSKKVVGNVPPSDLKKGISKEQVAAFFKLLGVTGGTCILTGLPGCAVLGAGIAIANIPVNKLQGRYITVYQQKWPTYVEPLDEKKDQYTLTITKDDVVVLKPK